MKTKNEIANRIIETRGRLKTNNDNRRKMFGIEKVAREIRKQVLEAEIATLEWVLSNEN
jgi:hypothetical protein